MEQIPVYLFLGFLESGKTKFIQETLEDTRFNQGEKTIILMCESGLEEYDLSAYKKNNVQLIEIDDETSITADKLSEINKKHSPERIMLEYNGMYSLNTLMEALPDNWAIAQTFLFVDSSTFITYNNNMRQLMFEKLQMADLVAFNRFDESKYSKEEFHKVVRVANRSCEIVYEDNNNVVTPDDIQDPLPFDLEAPIVEISDKDYAIWYSDLCESMDEEGGARYDGKTLKLHAMLISNKNVKDSFIIGRNLMTCCEADIRLAAIVCRNPINFKHENEHWYTVTGKLEIRFSAAYGKKGPVLTVETVEPSTAPENPVATFY
ncbi:MAG: GTPase [Clostridia bacterium]|nr:GTPase [Clostridia bacterium]